MHKGFSLLELIVVLGIIFIFATLSFGTYKFYQNKSPLDAAVSETVAALRRAEFQAQSNSGDQTWGVKLQTTGGTIFQGANFSGRTISADEKFELSPNLQFSGSTEIIFSKLTGFPVGGATSVTLTLNNVNKQININSKGAISY